MLDKEGLLREVRERGVELSGIDDLLKINNKYRDLIPIILKHLHEIDDEGDKEYFIDYSR